MESLASQEDDPTVVAMSGDLLTLDEMCGLQHVQERRMTARAKAAEARWRKARVELVKTKARATHTKSCVIALEELLEQPDHHSKLLRGVYLVEHAKERSVNPRVPTLPSWREFNCFPWPALIKGCASQCHPLH
jgi:hypothetical protein